MVFENSMIPAFKPGDHVLTFNWADINKGDVIAFRQDSSCYIKRIDRIDGVLIYVSGDNRKESFGMKPIKKEQIVGKVILRY